MKVVGIDGCPAGWFGFYIDDADNYNFAVHESLNKLVLALPADLYFIDMPIGLNTVNSQRQCDIELRKLLPRGLKSSVFSPPVKAALYAKSYQEACALNASKTGKKISLQAWNIMPKIKALDRFLKTNPGYRTIFFESHPETTFYHLNRGVQLHSNKRNKTGIAERIHLLKWLWQKSEVVFHSIIADTLRKHLKADDIVDAMVLALAARKFYPQNYLILPDQECNDVRVYIPQKKLPHG